MAFERIVGQTKAISFLQAALRAGRLAHAYLFLGPAGVGKLATAVEFAKALLCAHCTEDGACGICPSCRQVDELAHPALRLALPGPKEFDPRAERELLDRLAEEPYSVEQTVVHATLPIQRVRDLKQFAAFAGTGGRGSVVIVPLADRMNLEAANSLLKLLEEPPERFTLVLTTSEPDSLPQTILSRCQMLRFPPLLSEQIEGALIDRKGASQERARFLAQLASGSYGAAVAWLEADTDDLRQKAVEFLRSALKNFSERVRFIESLDIRDTREGRKELLELLDVLQVWLGDAQLISDLGEESANPYVVNADQLETLVRFTKNLSLVDYEQIVAALDDAAFQVQRNVSVRLILLGLLQRLHRSIRR